MAGEAPKPLSAAELRQIAMDNIANNHIGEEEGGITEDAARQIGFHGLNASEINEIASTAKAPEAPKPRLTSRQQNANAARREIEHKRNKRRGWR